MSVHEKLFHRAGPPGRAADPPGARARPAHRHRRAARRPDPRRRDRRAGGAWSAVGAQRGADSRGRRQAPLPGVRRPARAPAHARSGVQGEHRDRHDGGGRRRLLPADRDAEHRRRRSIRSACSRRSTATAGEQARGAHGLPRLDHGRAAGQRADRDGRAQRRRRARLHR